MPRRADKVLPLGQHLGVKLCDFGEVRYLPCRFTLRTLHVGWGRGHYGDQPQCAAVATMASHTAREKVLRRVVCRMLPLLLGQPVCSLLFGGRKPGETITSEGNNFRFACESLLGVFMLL